MMTKTAAVAFVALFTIIALLTGCVPLDQISEPTSVPGQQAATQSLLADAQAAIDANDFHQAEMHIERAVRIEPRNALLWHTMARIKFHKREYGQAVNFCLKSNSLIPGQNQLKKDNLLLMEQAYYQMGDYDKAMEARQQAAEIEDIR